MKTLDITLTVHGETDYDIEMAIDQAVLDVKKGYTSGTDNNDSGGYVFGVVETEGK